MADKATTGKADAGKADAGKADAGKVAGKANTPDPTPSVNDVPVDILTIGAPLAILPGRIGHVQHIGRSGREPWALVTDRPEPGSDSGVAGMFGTVGNGSKTGMPACTGHASANGGPVLSVAVGIGEDAVRVEPHYGFVGIVPPQYGAIDPVGRVCACARAFRLDGSLFAAPPIATVTPDPTATDAGKADADKADAK